MTTTAETLVPEQLWRAIQPLLPDRHPATAVALVSMTAPRWPGSSTSCAPASPGGCCPPASSAAAARTTCWRRLRDWQRAGVWQRLHQQLLDELGREGQLDWSRASLDSLSVRAKQGAS